MNIKQNEEDHQLKESKEENSNHQTKWTYNGIYMPSPRIEGEENWSCTKESLKLGKKTENKHTYNGISIPFPKAKVSQNSINIDGGSNFEYDESIEVDWEGELVSTLE